MASTSTTSEAGREVLALGKAVLKAFKEGGPEVIEDLERYMDAFEEWQKTWNKAPAGKVQFSAKEEEIGRRIADQHATVIMQTEEMKKAVEQSLKNLRGWSKSIRAYIDHLPKQIGTMRPRKG